MFLEKYKYGKNNKKQIFQVDTILSMNGFSLTEVLVSIMIMFTLIMTFVPLIMMSLDTIIKSGEKADRLLEAQGKIEIVSATKEGLIAEDGSFIPVTDGSFPLRVAGDSKKDDIAGGKIEVEDLRTFVASIPSVGLNPYSLIEGYSADEPGGNRKTITVTGVNTHFKPGSTSIQIRDKNNTIVSVSYKSFLDVQGSSQTSGTFWISTNPGLSASGSPYYITFSTGSEEVSAMLTVSPSQF